MTDSAGRDPADPEARSTALRTAERVKFFTDAVVAIAMTLLILPLLEGVREAAQAGLTTGEYLHESQGQLFAFALSFVLIATFWVSHERLYSLVGTWNTGLMMLNFAWMLTIVFLPVVTALVGSIDTDNLQFALYVGTMLATSVFMLAMNVLVRRTPHLLEEGAHPGLGGVTAGVAVVVLFAVALVAGLFLREGAKFYALFLLAASGPVEHLFRRVIRRRAAAT